jgi:WD40 repeat protein
VLSLEFSPNAGELARFCFGYAVALYDTTNYRRARTFLTMRWLLRLRVLEARPRGNDTLNVLGIGFSPDGKLLITTYRNDRVKVWNTSSWTVERELISGPDQKVDALWTGFSPDGKLLITTYRNDRVKVWNTSSWTVERELISGPDQKVDALWTGFSPDGKLLLTMHPNGHVKVWNTSSWTVVAELAVTDSRLTAAAFAPDNKTVMIADENGVLHHWSLATKVEIRTLRTLEGLRKGVSVSGLEFSPDGETLVATTLMAAKPVIIWNATDWIAQTETGFNSAAFSKDGKLMALGGQSHIKLIDPASRKQFVTSSCPT